ncbi:MAG: DUF2835 domain-containing protein [Cellvibrionaceae bacterium]
MQRCVEKELVVDLTISSDEFERLYAGQVKTVLATSRDGRRVRFPANILVPFVEREGIRGSFAIAFDIENKFQQIRRL